MNRSGIGDYSYYTNISVTPFWFGLSLQATAVITAILAIALFCVTVLLFRTSRCRFVSILACMAIGCLIGLALSWVTNAEYLHLFVFLRWTIPVLILQALLSALLTFRAVRAQTVQNNLTSYSNLLKKRCLTGSAEPIKQRL